MCEPTTLMIIAGGMAAAGSLTQGYSALQQGNYESAIARQNAQLSRESAAESLKTGQKERRDFWRKVGSVKGQQIASMAANGIDVGYGTAERIQEDTQALADEDASTLYENIHHRTRGYTIEAANYKAESKAAKQRGRAAFVGSVFEAGSSMLGSVSQAKGMKAKLGTSSGYG